MWGDQGPAADGVQVPRQEASLQIHRGVLELGSPTGSGDWRRKPPISNQFPLVGLVALRVGVMILA